jgi:hypothetical protein
VTRYDLKSPPARKAGVTFGSGIFGVWITMLVLGALHSSDGLAAIPALGFWQTWGVLILVGHFGYRFRGPRA